MIAFESLGTVSYLHSIVTVAVSCIVSVRERAVHVIILPWRLMWCEKTRMALLPDSKKKLMICLAVSTEYRRVRERERYGKTDERMDTQTSFDSMVRAICIALRGKNYTYSCDCPYYSRNLTDANKDIIMCLQDPLLQSLSVFCCCCCWWFL